MYTCLQITDATFLQKLFPSLKLTPDTTKKICNIWFFGLEFSKGFKARKTLLQKKLSDNGIVTNEIFHPHDVTIISDKEAVATGPIGSL